MMRPPIDEPDFLDDATCEWAGQHREVLERVVEQLSATGDWPVAEDLTREFVREGQPIPIASVLFSMPKALGFLEAHPQRVVLTVFGLRMTHAGHKLLAGFNAVLRLAAERYASEASKPTITRQDAARGTVIDDPYVTALSRVLQNQAPFFGSGTGSPDTDWEREVTEDVVRYWHDLTAESYLRRRAAELRLPAHLGWEALTEQTLPDQTAAHQSSEDDPPAPERDVFICHASEDKDVVARPLAAGLEALSYSVWLDESELVIGDSLSQSIEQGLAHCRFGVVILSRSFFAKRWTTREIAGLTAREVIDGRRMILPVWHEIDSDFLVSHAPTLADLLAARTSDGIDHVTAQISRAIQKRQV